MARFTSHSNSGGGLNGEQIQADWNQSESNAVDFIKNKPTIDNSTKTWTAGNSSVYEIRQAHGGIEVILPNPLTTGETITIVGNSTNSSSVIISVSTEMSTLLLNLYNGGEYFRRITIDLGTQTGNFAIAGAGISENQWILSSMDGGYSLSDGSNYYMNVHYSGAPVIWWNADNLNFMPEGDEWKFRGAKIEYHAYSQDSGTIIGTIYIANDNGDNNATHLETASGANDIGTVVLWKRSGSEKELYAYRTDDESDTLKIHWTAQVYYGTEYYD